MATAIPKTETYYAPDRAAWRAWLAANHATCTGIWLIYYKKDSGKTRVSYDHAVEEALCYGWIDSTLNPIDTDSYMQLFMPRKDKSGWSRLNKERVERLTTEGLMTPAGLERVAVAQKLGTWNHLDHVEDFVIPVELEHMFRQHKGCREYFETLSTWNRKYILYRLHNAKRPETRQKRIEEIMEALLQKRLPERLTPKKKNDKG
jgi:uncharacterized protein YdeI (YjbR/CyaY-like superfamily)